MKNEKDNCSFVDELEELKIIILPVKWMTSNEFVIYAYRIKNIFQREK